MISLYHFFIFLCLNFSEAYLCCSTDHIINNSIDNNTLNNGINNNSVKENATCSLGRQISLLEKVIGGSDAAVGQFPWQVYIADDNKSCGATLISNQWLVTAAHCSIDISRWHAYLGDINITKHDKQTKIKIVEFIKHPKYISYPNDIALLKLETSVSITSRIRPISLPYGQSPTPGSRAIISGWGKTAENGNKSAILQQAVVCVFENSVCQVGDPLIICAGVTETIVDTCNGDSGGPLIAVNKTGEYYLAGVTSRGFGCEGKGVYTKVSAFETWILETIGNDSI